MYAYKNLFCPMHMEENAKTVWLALLLTSGATRARNRWVCFRAFALCSAILNLAVLLPRDRKTWDIYGLKFFFPNAYTYDI